VTELSRNGLVLNQCRQRWQLPSFYQNAIERCLFAEERTMARASTKKTTSKPRAAKAKATKKPARKAAAKTSKTVAAKKSAPKKSPASTVEKETPIKAEVLHPLSTLKDDIDRAFHRAFHGWPRFGGLLQDWDPFEELEPMFNRLTSRRLPRTDLKESDEDIRIQMELPGVAGDDLELSISGDMLTVKGEKKSEREEDAEGYHLSERSYGRFERAFRLPENADTDKVEAEFENGVLRVTLSKKKAPRSKARKLNVKAS
jgi:HSP20 family protein